MCNCQDTLIPQIGVVTDVCKETADVKTYRVEKPGEANFSNTCRGNAPCFPCRGWGKLFSPLPVRRPIKITWNSA
jgi:hypothetical protein